MHVEDGHLRSIIPAGACDTHAHVIAKKGYPFCSERSYTPDPAPEDAYISMLDHFFMRFGVLIQVSVYGTDNRYLTKVLQRHPERLRGIAVVDTDVDDAELARLHACGVRGIRINALFGGASRLHDMEALAKRIAPYGWHIQLYLDPTLLRQMTDRLSRLPCPVVLDHMAHISVEEGLSGTGFRALLHIAQADHVWVKLSAANRISKRVDFSDTTIFAHALIENGADRLLWGSDWPHVACSVQPDTEMLVNLIEQWMPESEIRNRILVSNPSRLYGFDGAKN